MKTNFFKIVIPAVSIIMAIAGSFASHANVKKAPQILVTGYYNTNPSLPGPCLTPIQCSNILGPVCTVVTGGQTFQAWGKEFPDDNICNIVLYRL